jgi:hypothetical protein
VRSLFQRSKDATVGFAARAAINSKLRGIGEVTDLTIDTRNKTLRVEVELIGENEPVVIHVTEYRLHTGNRGPLVTIERATTSREWLNVALQQFVIGKKFPIPPKVEPLLRLLG